MGKASYEPAETFTQDEMCKAAVSFAVLSCCRSNLASKQGFGMLAKVSACKPPLATLELVCLHLRVVLLVSWTCQQMSLLKTLLTAGSGVALWTEACATLKCLPTACRLITCLLVNKLLLHRQTACVSSLPCCKTSIKTRESLWQDDVAHLYLGWQNVLNKAP